MQVPLVSPLRPQDPQVRVHASSPAEGTTGAWGRAGPCLLPGDSGTVRSPPAGVAETRALGVSPTVTVGWSLGVWVLHIPL